MTCDTFPGHGFSRRLRPFLGLTGASSASFNLLLVSFVKCHESRPGGVSDQKLGQVLKQGISKGTEMRLSRQKCEQEPHRSHRTHVSRTRPAEEGTQFGSGAGGVAGCGQPGARVLFLHSQQVLSSRDHYLPHKSHLRVH